MIIVNKHTKIKRDISLVEFKKEFSNDIKIAYQSFKKTQLNKSYFNVKLKLDANIENDFNFDFQWNFNNFGNSAWYIERM